MSVVKQITEGEPEDLELVQFITDQEKQEFLNNWNGHIHEDSGLNIPEGWYGVINDLMMDFKEIKSKLGLPDGKILIDVKNTDLVVWYRGIKPLPPEAGNAAYIAMTTARSTCMRCAGYQDVSTHPVQGMHCKLCIACWNTLIARKNVAKKTEPVNATKTGTWLDEF